MKCFWKATNSSNAAERLGCRSFVGGIFLGALLSAALSFILYVQSVTEITKLLNTAAQDVLEQQQIIIQEILATLKSDTLFLSHLENLKKYINSDDQTLICPSSKDYSSFLTARGIYDQIRYIDEYGMEIIRVNKIIGGSRIIPESALQYKGDRPYFLDTVKLKLEQIYLSEVDLNMENGEIEVPYKPTLRLGTPMYDNWGNQHGIVILNFLVDHLFDKLSDVVMGSAGVTMLVNPAGYYLQGPDPDRCWGFMLPGGQEHTLAKDAPEAWKIVATGDNGQFVAKKGLYSFVTIYPELAHLSPEVEHDTRAMFHWKLIHFTPADAIGKRARNARLRYISAGGVIFVLSVVIAGLASRLITRRQAYRIELEKLALYDALTGLPNRRLFFDRLDAAVNSAERYKRLLAVVYIDLDGFKAVNDTLGHDAGDELLKRVAKQLGELSRKSDTLARLGGDEFALLLGEIPDVQTAESVAAKLLASLQAPIRLKHGEARIGASIGIALYPLHAETPASLVRAADQAMYRSKQAGKGTITVADQVPRGG